MTQMIHAIQIHEQGRPEVLRYEEVDSPESGLGQVRLRQTTGGINFLDSITPQPGRNCWTRLRY